MQQACHRLEVGEDALVEGKPQMIALAGLSFAREGPDPVSPSAIVCLSGAGLLLHRSGTAPPDAA